MNKENIINSFKGYEFFADDHHYEYNGVRVGTSVTTLIHEYTNFFDKDKMSEVVSKKTGESKEAILKKWEVSNLYSTIKGTLCHEYAQGLWNGVNIKADYTDISSDINIDELRKSVNRINEQALKFYEDHKDLYTIVKDEFIIGDLDYDIAGSIDNLFLDKKNNLVMIDYKTNKKIDRESFRSKMMLKPLDNVMDCNYMHYCLQLNIYKIILEKNTDFKIGSVYIVYFDEQKDNYEKIKIKNLYEESLRLLNTRVIRSIVD